MSATPTTTSTTQLTQAMLRWQVLVTVVVAVLATLLGSQSAGISAALGGTAVIVGAWVASRIAARGEHMQQPGAVLINMLKAEAVKILIIAIFLFVIFKLYHALVPFALVAGLGAAALFSGAALAKSQASV
jgi:ATP synthase protein I